MVLSWTGRSLYGLLMLVCLVSAESVQATQYQLQVANIDRQLFFRYVETQGVPLRAERHVLPRLDAMLDAAQLSEQLLIPDRRLQLVEAVEADAQRAGSVAITMTSWPRRTDPWMTVRWQGTEGNVVIFQIQGHQVHYQELAALAVNADGVLRRLPVRNVPLFGSQRLLAPSMSKTYLEYRLAQGTFGDLVERFAEPRNGLAVVVGRSHDPHFPDAVYLLVRMAARPKTYKVVLAWQDQDVLRQDNDGDENERGR